MGLLKFLVSCICSFFQARFNPRTSTPEPSALSKLPPELVLCISGFLLPESVLSFSLCCQRVHFIIRAPYLEALKENNETSDHRYKFLKLLEQDLPDHILCYYCKKLHTISKARQYVSCLPYMKNRDNFLAGFYIHPRFSFVIFQMTMKRHRQGLDPSSLLNFLSFTTITLFEKDYTEQYSTSIRIIADSLLFRQQQIFMIPSTQPCLLPKDLKVCPHIRLCTRRTESTLTSKVYRVGEGGMQCKYCMTEFRIDYRMYEDQGTAMFITKWMDLGQGRSPMDWQWQSHISELWGDLCSRTARFELGSICARFEGKEFTEFKFDSLLTPQDKKALFSSL